MNRFVLAIFTMAAAFEAGAQLLPPVQVPPVQVPPVRLPVELPDIDRTVRDVTSAVDPRELLNLRRDRIRDLLRTQRQVLERDPQGAPIVRAEVVAFDPTDEALARARAAGFSVLREQVLEGLGARTVVLQAPRGLSTSRALRRLRDLDPQGAYDFNHIYLESGVVGVAREPGVRLAQAAQQQQAAAPAPIKVGLIDGGVDASHPVFAGKPPRLHGCAGKPVASAHGTAVASLLTGHAGDFAGSLPGGDLYAADVYCGAAGGGAVDAIADAFAWLARERVAVINVSLVGPPNVALERIVRLVIARGHIVVAAVGNDGPSARPLYPAAYPGVIGVTGVDAKRRVLIEALRGDQVDFAATGAELTAANDARTFAAVRGTSFAAPVVAGLLAREMDAPGAAPAAQAVEKLTAAALDLGAKGRDRVFGVGFVAVTR